MQFKREKSCLVCRTLREIVLKSAFFFINSLTCSIPVIQWPQLPLFSSPTYVYQKWLPLSPATQWTQLAWKFNKIQTIHQFETPVCTWEKLFLIRKKKYERHRDLPERYKHHHFHTKEFSHWLNWTQFLPQRSVEQHQAVHGKLHDKRGNKHMVKIFLLQCLDLFCYFKYSHSRPLKSLDIVLFLPAVTYCWR